MKCLVEELKKKTSCAVKYFMTDSVIYIYTYYLMMYSSIKRSNIWYYKSARARGKNLSFWRREIVRPLLVVNVPPVNLLLLKTISRRRFAAAYCRGYNKTRSRQRREELRVIYSKTSGAL